MFRSFKVNKTSIVLNERGFILNTIRLYFIKDIFGTPLSGNENDRSWFGFQNALILNQLSGSRDI